MSYTPPNSTSITFNFTDSPYSTPSSPLSIDFVVDEDAPYTLNILAGNSRNFTSIWADTTANIQTGSVYAASAGTGAAFSVVNMTTQALTDRYLIDVKGSMDESLESENIVDINIST